MNLMYLLPVDNVYLSSSGHVLHINVALWVQIKLSKKLIKSFFTKRRKGRERQRKKQGGVKAGTEAQGENLVGERTFCLTYWVCCFVAERKDKESENRKRKKIREKWKESDLKTDHVVLGNQYLLSCEVRQVSQLQ